MFISKLKAAAFHLLVSSVILGLFIAFVFLYWYPGALAYVSGLTKIVLMLIAIDLVIGPFLTFVVYRPNKPKLLFDMSVVAVIQLIALGYGTFALYESHPIYVTYATDGYRVITANEVDPERAKLDIYKKNKLSSPMLAFTKIPDDIFAASELTLEILSGKPDVDFRPELYQSYDNNLNEIFANSISIEKLQASKSGKIALEQFLEDYDNVDDFAFLPLEGKAKSGIWAISRKTGKPVDILKVNPWSLAKNSNRKDQ